MSRLLSLFMFSMLIIITGCQSTPEPPLTPKLQKYAETKNSCEELLTDEKVAIPSDLKNICKPFLKRLAKSNAVNYELHHFNEGKVQISTKPSPAYIELEKKNNYQCNRLDQAHERFVKEINNFSLQAIANDQLFDVELSLRFKETKFTKKHYEYLKRLAPLYDQEPHYKAYETQLALTKVRKGLSLLSLGKKRKALTLFKEASALGNGEAAFLAGTVYEEKHVDKAIEWHTKALERGMTPSRLSLARLYKRNREPKLSQKYYTEAAEAGDAYAQFLLYQKYQRTQNSKSNALASEWLLSAAKNHYPIAEYTYGLTLLREKKRKEAKKWLLRAYKHGIKKSSSTLGALYFKDEAYEKALNYLLQANTSYSRYRLGMMYEHGLGVRVNNYTAYMYYKEAFRLGKKNAKKDVQRLKKQYSASERAHYDAAFKKNAKKMKDFVKRCGETTIVKNLRVEGTLIHIEGIITLPLPSATGYLVHDEKEQLYFVANKQTQQALKPYQYINITAKTTGNAVSISNDKGLLSPVYQLRFQHQCQL